jgi:hypothetical protein
MAVRPNLCHPHQINIAEQTPTTTNSTEHYDTTATLLTDRSVPCAQKQISLFERLLGIWLIILQRRTLPCLSRGQKNMFLRGP